MSHQGNVWELFLSGGAVMWPLLLCSIIIWAIAIEKYWVFKQFKKQSRALFLEAERLLKDGKFHEAKGLCHNTHHAIAECYMFLFDDDAKKNKNIWQEKMGRKILEVQIFLKKYLWILATISVTAPFIGLFGTVVGIIRSFQSIAITGKSGFSVVSGGLSEALIATAAGIIIAVIATIIYNYFQSQLSVMNTRFKNGVEDLINQFDR